MYFSKFPAVTYPMKSGSTFRYVLARNITRRIALSDGLKSSGSAFIQYNVKNGERPEHIAEKLYGDPTLHWLVLLTNDIIDPYHDWCMSDNAMEEYVQKKHAGYSVYFTNSSNEFLYSSQIMQGATLAQGSVLSTVVQYFPTMCKVTVSASSFSEGAATLTGVCGSVYSVNIHRIDQTYVSAHHFEVVKGSSDLGASTTVEVDPLSQQTGFYSNVGGVLGATTDEYPTPTNNSLNYSPSAVVDLHETYVGKYMGIVGDKVDLYSVNNLIHETRLNEQKRTIKLLHPRYKADAMNELESLLRV